MCIQGIAKSEKQNNKISFLEGFKQNYVTGKAIDRMVIKVSNATKKKNGYLSNVSKSPLNNIKPLKVYTPQVQVKLST